MKPLALLQKIALKRSITRRGLPIEERWRLAGEELPRSAWHSFDRTPWNHPWLQKQNLREFADFSRQKLHQLRSRIDLDRPSTNRYAFVGNMANVNYIRALPLRRRGMNVDLVLHPQDDFAFAQPAWEDLDGDLSDLEAASGQGAAGGSLPDWVHRFPIEANWSTLALRAERTIATPQQVLLWPEYMPYFGTLAKLSQYDSLLVSQFPYLGFLSGRPYVFGQIGGEIWFEASRNDSLGILTRRALASSYAVLVSNPITLAHARRYGLRNLIYLPWPLDEETYSPGEGGPVRAEWQRQMGGRFFVLTSMRMDRNWKGAQHVLDGFVRFSAEAPEARLLILGWGDDLEYAKGRVAELGLAERVYFLEKVGKRRLISYLRAADVVTEQFVLGYYGASGLEAMACGKPVIMRLERDQYEGLIDVGAPPVLDANDGISVAKQLRRLYDDPALCATVGAQTRKWFLSAQSSERWFETHRILLEAMASGIPLSFDDSPLCAPLSPDELNYHAEQLSGAPPFPHYVDP